jgi:hypothetical protein
MGTGTDADAASSAMKFVEPFIRNAEGASMEDKDLDSNLCGLNKQISRKDKTVAWVSDDAMYPFIKEGKAAIASQLRLKA